MNKQLRFIDLGRQKSILALAHLAAEREGLSGREAKEVARYAIHLHAAHISAARAISRATQYARIRAGNAVWGWYGSQHDEN